MRFSHLPSPSPVRMDSGVVALFHAFSLFLYFSHPISLYLSFSLFLFFLYLCFIIYLRILKGKCEFRRSGNQKDVLYITLILIYK